MACGIFWSDGLGLRRGRALFLQTTIEEQRLLSHTLQQRQSGFLRLVWRGEPLHFLRQGGTTESRLEGQPELLCGRARAVVRTTLPRSPASEPAHVAAVAHSQPPHGPAPPVAIARVRLMESKPWGDQLSCARKGYASCNAWLLSERSSWVVEAPRNGLRFCQTQA